MTPLLETTGWWVWSGEAKGSKSAWGFSFSSGFEYWYPRGPSFASRGFAVRSRKYSLPLQKSRMLQIQGIRAAAVVFYRKALITPEMGYYRLSLRVKNMVVFTIYWMSLGVCSTKAEKKSVNTYH